MRIGELSSAAGVPIATVKWYLRIGLLPKGDPTARNQADYGEHHLRRLRFVRAVIEVGGLSTEQAQRIVDVLDDPASSARDVAAAAHAAISDRTPPRGVEASAPAVDRYLRSRGWTIDDDSPARADLAAVITALRVLEGDVGTDAGPAVGSDVALAALLDPYADALEPIAAAEISGLPASRSEELAERIVLGTVLMDQAIGALRRLAQENAFVARPPDADPA
jgi:DNA-binding transcriptional MerR regulator